MKYACVILAAVSPLPQVSSAGVQPVGKHSVTFDVPVAASGNLPLAASPPSESVRAVRKLALNSTFKTNSKLHAKKLKQISIMSWQDYVDKQLLASRCVSDACIAGHDGIVWAKSEGFEVAKEEIAKLVQGFDKQDILAANGVTLAGNRYIYLSGTDRVVRCKLGKVGVHCMKTTQAVVVSLYKDPIQPQQAASVVEKLGDYLITCGY